MTRQSRVANILFHRTAPGWYRDLNRFDSTSNFIFYMDLWDIASGQHMRSRECLLVIGRRLLPGRQNSGMGYQCCLLEG